MRKYLFFVFIATLWILNSCNNHRESMKYIKFNGNDKQLKILLNEWKSNGVYTDKIYKSKNELMRYIKSIGDFDLNPISNLEKEDHNKVVITVENKYFTLKVGCWPYSGEYEISAIFIKKESQNKFSLGLKENTLQELEKRYGNSVLNEYDDTESMFEYYTKYHQSIIINVDENKNIIDYGIANYYF